MSHFLLATRTISTCVFTRYRPQRSLGKVMFLQASVILLTGGVPHTPPGADPQEQTPPRADTPP